MIACVLFPRFRLLAALGEARRELLVRPVALGPRPGGPQVVGEPSGRAEAFGVRAGMRLAEALARCPELVLVATDDEAAEEAWEGILRRLEQIGAAVESERAGEVFLETGGLRGLWGDAAGVMRRARRTLGGRARLGAGPNRLCAHAAALRDRPRPRDGRRREGREPLVVAADGARAFLAPLPVGLLHERLRGEWERATLPGTLERLGVDTLGRLAGLPDAAIADRFGESGLRALRMARGEPERLRPRRRHEELVVGLELPEACSGMQLERALELLVDRLLAHPERRARSLRRLRLGARLAGGGSWRSEVTLRQASAAAERLRLALAPRLAELPGPADSLLLRALEIGPLAREQPSLVHSPRERRGERLAEAVRQARAAAGKDAVLRVLEADHDSRLPERRALLTPFPEAGE